MNVAVINISEMRIIDYNIISKLYYINEKLNNLNLDITYNIYFHGYQNLFRIIKSVISVNELIIIMDDYDSHFPNAIDNTLNMFNKNLKSYAFLDVKQNIIGKYYKSKTLCDFLVLSSSNDNFQIDDILIKCLKNYLYSSQNNYKIVSFFNLNKTILDKYVRDFCKSHKFLKFKLICHYGDVKLLLSGPSTVISQLVNSLKNHFSNYYYNSNNLFSLLVYAMKILKHKNKTISIATNFIIKNMELNNMDVLKIFLYISDDNMKEKILHIPYQILNAYGDSEIVSNWMASKIKLISNSDIGLGIVKDIDNKMIYISIKNWDDTVYSFPLLTKNHSYNYIIMYALWVTIRHI